MALTVDERLDLQRDSVRVLLGNVRAARTSGDYGIAATDSALIFDAQLLMALLQWRRGSGDARASIVEAVDTARATRELLREMGGKDLWQILNFGAATLAAYLLDGAFDAGLRGDLPPPGAWAKVKASYIETPLLAALIGAMADGVRASEAEAVMARVSAMKRVELMAATYAKYDQIVDACRAGSPIEPLVRDAETLFLKRKRNAYYAGGVQIAGGGPDNEFTVDYMLAAVLAWCERNGSEAVDTIHAWRW